MRWLVAIVVPPLAVLMCGKPMLAVLNCFFTLLCWIPGIFHALLIVAECKADERARRYH